MADNTHLENIARAIEKGTRVTTLEELKAKGQSSFKVINAAKIMELIKDAVDMAVDSMSGSKLAGEKEKLQALAKKEFDELLKRYQDTQKGKGEIESQAAKMQAEIDEVARLLAGGGGDAAKMGLAGISGQIAQLVQKLQASEKARIDGGVSQRKAEDALEQMKLKYAAMEQEKAAAMETGQGVARSVDAAYSKIDATLGQKAREMGLNFGPEPRTPEEKMERLAQIAQAAVQGMEKEKIEKAELKRQLAQAQQELAATSGNKSTVERELSQARQTLAQTQAKQSAAEKELGELQDFKRKLEEKVDEQGSQYAEVHQMMARIGQRADDLIREVESGRLKHLKPEEKKIIIDAMTAINQDLKKLQDERAFLEKKLFYMSMTIDSLEAELLAAKGLTPAVSGSAHLKDDGLVVTFDEAGVAAL
ncbi:MAG: hypothetical protein FD180_51 [Planctomycetota bacterium]|nr:MAG: hypothetical protein FD180_51 [Planctomycetota bacterium]